MHLKEGGTRIGDVPRQEGVIMNMKKYFEQGMLSLLERKKIDSITVGEIIEKVGSCKGTFYKHYMDKYYLCCNCLQNRVYCDISADTDSWEEFILQCLSAFEKNDKIILHAFDSEDINSARNYHKNLTAEYLVKKYVANGGDTASPLGLLALRLYASTVTDLIVKWLSDGCRESKEEMYCLICAVMPQTVFERIGGSARAAAI